MPQFAVVFVLLLLTATARAVPLTIILLPGTTLTDWRNAPSPALHQLMATGALAVMNTRTARTSSDRVRETPTSAVLTLGAGSRAAGDGVRFYPQTAIVPGTGVRAGELYTRRMGVRPPPDALVCPDWARILQGSTNRGYDIHIGNLGTALQAAGIAVNAQGSFARLLVATDAGTLQNSASPAVRVVQSDMAHVNLLLRVLKRDNAQLIVVSPFVPDSACARGDRLSPVLWWGAGVPAGLMYSPSTRRAGLVLNTDFAPTIAAQSNATLPALAFGQAWTVQTNAENVLAVSQLEQRAYQQATLLRLLPACALTLGVCVLVGIVSKRRGFALVPVVLVFTLAVSTSHYAFALWVVAVGLAAVLGRRTIGTHRTVTAGCSLLAMILTADTLTGNRLMQTAMLGYSAPEGARFYGIGNEAMGALVGASLVAAARLWSGSTARRVWVAIALVFVVLLLGTAGAKAGGVLVGGGAFAVLLWTLCGRRVSWRLLLTATAGAAFLLLTFALLDLHGGTHSHFGRALSRIGTGGFSELWDIATRKASVEGRLLWHSLWAVPLWAAVIGIVRQHHAPLRTVGLTSVALCLLFNDAGVVAGALCGCIVWAGLATNKTARTE